MYQQKHQRHRRQVTKKRPKPTRPAQKITKQQRIATTTNAVTTNGPKCVRLMKFSNLLIPLPIVFKHTNSGLFLIIAKLSKQNFKKKIALSGIQTKIVGIKGKNNYH